jgi:hypothetical protein
MALAVSAVDRRHTDAVFWAWFAGTIVLGLGYLWI